MLTRFYLHNRVAQRILSLKKKKNDSYLSDQRYIFGGGGLAPFFITSGGHCQQSLPSPHSYLPWWWLDGDRLSRRKSKIPALPVVGRALTRPWLWFWLLLVSSAALPREIFSVGATSAAWNLKQRCHQGERRNPHYCVNYDSAQVLIHKCQRGFTRRDFRCHQAPPWFEP